MCIWDISLKIKEQALAASRLGVWLVTSTALLSVPAIAQQYRLAPGDRVLLQIMQLDNLSYVATVDTAGEIRLPYLGTHLAEAKTLDELSQDIALAVAGQQIRSVQDGVASVIVLDEEDIFLDVDTYRPVTVIGAVASPGQVDFQPGLSLRAALGSAGGTALAGQTERVEQLANFRTRLAELRETEAWLAAELWRIDVMLTGKPSDVPFDGRFEVVAEHLDESDRDEMRRLVDGARDALQRDRDDNAARIALTEKRIDFLQTALDQYVTASEFEEARLQDVLELSQRGLNTINALDNARDGALNASSRVLTTQADLAEAEREMVSLRIDKEAIEADYTQALLDEQARLEQDYDETRARIASLNRELALGSVVEEEDSPTDIRYLLHRQTATGEITMDVSPSERLQPGDVVEVVVTLD